MDRVETWVSADTQVPLTRCGNALIADDRVDQGEFGTFTVNFHVRTPGLPPTRRRHSPLASFCRCHLRKPLQVARNAIACGHVSCGEDLNTGCLYS
jgi:hypothetical protein